MPNPGSIGDAVPAGEDWLVRKVQDLERKVEEMAAASTLNAATVDQGGIQVTNGGTVTVTDSTNQNVIAEIGALPTIYNRADGSRQPGVMFNREDGSLALILGDLNPTTPPYKAALQSLDRAGNVIFADDTNGGVGIARPYIAMGAWVDNVASGSAAAPTTSAAYVTQQTAFAYLQHPKVRVDMLVNSTLAGTTGTIGLFDPTGAQIGSDLSVPANSVTFASIGPVAVRPGWVFGENGYWTLRAKRTAGTGAIGVRGTGFWGVQS